MAHSYRPPYGYNPGGLQPGSQQQHPMPGQVMQAHQHPMPGQGMQPHQQQHLMPGQVMQPHQSYPGVGMIPQGYQVPGQPGLVMAPGITPGVNPGLAPTMMSGMSTGMTPGMYYPNQQPMVQQGFIPSGMMIPGGVIPPQQQVPQGPPKPLTDEQRRQEEKMKKERYFQEQKMKLKQFGRGSKPGLSLDMADTLVDSLAGPTKTNSQPSRGKPTAQHLPAQAIESFGDFQQAIGASPLEEDDFGDFLQARSDVTPSVVEEVQAPEIAEEPQGTAQVPPPGDTPTLSQLDPPPPKKEEISLEDMMRMSTDLSEATKSAKPIHVKKTLNEVKPQHHPASGKPAVYAASNKSRAWKDDNDFSTLFNVGDPGLSVQGVQQDSTEASSGVDAGSSHHSLMPSWCSDPSQLPLVYRQVYEASFVNGFIQTESLYPILLMSGLDRAVLGQIWNMVNKNQSGVLEQQELYCALALIALQQNELPTSMEYLVTLKEAPVPNLTPQLSVPPANTATGNTAAPVQTSSISQIQPVTSESIGKDSSPEAVISFSQVVAKEKETYNAQFDREDHMGDEQIPISTFKRNQPDPQPQNSLEEEFAEFQSSRSSTDLQPTQPMPFLPAPPEAPYQFKTVTMASKPTKSATSPNLKSLTEGGSDVDVEFGDFSSHRAVQPSVLAVQGGGVLTPGVSAPTEQWASFQHASSEPSLMSNESDDKYAAFKVLATPQTDDTNVSIPMGSTSQSTAVESDDDCGSALRGMVSESSDEEPFANFQSASIPPEIFMQGLHPPATSHPPTTAGVNFNTPALNDDLDDNFGDFLSLQESKKGAASDDGFGDFSTFEGNGRGTNLPSSITLPQLEQQGNSTDLPYSLPTDLESESSPGMNLTPGQLNLREGSTSVDDRYAAFADLQLTVTKQPEEDDFGDFHAVEPSLDSTGVSLAFDHMHPEQQENKTAIQNSMNNSLNGLDLQNNNDNSMKPPPLHPGLDGPSLLLPESLGGDRYAVVAGDTLDDNRHITAWERCLSSCHSTIKTANDVLNNISSSSVCKEVTSSSSGNEYFKAIIEVYRVACRVFASIKARGVETDTLVKLNDDIEKTWTNLAAFLSATTLQIDNGSFVFKTATLKPDPDNQDKACGVCLLNVDARSKAFNRTEDFHKLNYGGRQYHATCANLWVNMVDSLLPALPLEALL